MARRALGAYPKGKQSGMLKRLICTGIEMRLTSFRNLLLALAMVFQTVAGGAGIAHAASISPEETLSAQCHHMRAGEQPAPDDRPGHRHNCQSCLLCGEPPPAWVSLASDYLVSLGEYARFDAPIFARRPLSERLSRAHSARAPPFSRA